MPYFPRMAACVIARLLAAYSNEPRSPRATRHRAPESAELSALLTRATAPQLPGWSETDGWCGLDEPRAARTNKRWQLSQPPTSGFVHPSHVPVLQ